MEEMLRGCIVTLSGCSGLGGSIAALQWVGAVVVRMQHCSTAWGGSCGGGGAALQHCMGWELWWGCSIAALQWVDHVGWGCNTAASHGGAVGGLLHCSTAWGCCVGRLQHCSTVWGCCGGVAALQHHVAMLGGGLQHCSTALSARSAALHETAAAR